MRGSTNSTVDKGVFGVAVVISVAFLLWGVLAKDNLAGVTSAVLDYVVANFGWQTAAILSAAPFVLVMIGLCFSVFKALRGEQLPETRPSPGAAPEPGRAPARPSGVPAPQQACAVDPNTKK